MKFENPTGTKIIQIKDTKPVHVELTDFENGSRDFTLTVELLSEEAECHITGRAQSTGTDRKSWQIKQIFKGVNQTGSIDLRGTAENDSFLAFDGAATLTTESIDADANIEEKIVLFDNAKGRSLPVLRVETDQVKSASHGASIAPVDSEKLLYLASRGIHNSTAQDILKAGFLSL